MFALRTASPTRELLFVIKLYTTNFVYIDSVTAATLLLTSKSDHATNLNICFFWDVKLLKLPMAQDNTRWTASRIRAAPICNSHCTLGTNVELQLIGFQSVASLTDISTVAMQAPGILSHSV